MAGNYYYLYVFTIDCKNSAYSLSSLTEPLLQIARYVSFYTLKVLKIEEPLNLDVNVTQMMKTLAIQTTADYGTIDLSVNIPVKDLPTFLSVLSDGWENVRIRDVNKYVDELAGENFAEVASISVAETVTLLNLIKAKHTVMSEKLNMFAAFFMSCSLLARICFLCVRGKRQIVSSRLFLLLRHHL